MHSSKSSEAGAGAMPTEFPGLNEVSLVQRIAFYTELLRSSPGRVPILRDRALAYAQRGQAQEALADMTSAIQLTSTDDLAGIKANKILLAEVHSAVESSAEVLVPVVDAALAISDLSVEERVQLMVIKIEGLIKDEQWGNALQVINQAIADPAISGAQLEHRYLAERRYKMYCALGEQSGQRESLNVLLAIDPNNITYLGRRAKLLENLGEVNAAIADLERLGNLCSRDSAFAPNINRHIARLQEVAFRREWGCLAPFLRCLGYGPVPAATPAREESSALPAPHED